MEVGEKITLESENVIKFTPHLIIYALIKVNLIFFSDTTNLKLEGGANKE